MDHCEHCGGSGILRIAEALEHGMTVAVDYDTWCHACPAGHCWRAALEPV